MSEKPRLLDPATEILWLAASAMGPLCQHGGVGGPIGLSSSIRQQPRLLAHLAEGQSGVGFFPNVSVRLRGQL